MATRISPEVKALHEALRADLDAAKAGGAGLKMVAAAFGRSVAWASGLANGHHPLRVEEFGTWASVTGGEHVARWVAERVDCDLFPREDGGLEATSIDALREATEAAHVALSAMSDGRVTADELKAYRKEMREAIENFLRLGRAMEALSERGAADRDAPGTLAEAEARRGRG